MGVVRGVARKSLAQGVDEDAVAAVVAVQGFLGAAAGADDVAAGFLADIGQRGGADGAGVAGVDEQQRVAGADRGERGYQGGFGQRAGFDGGPAGEVVDVLRDQQELVVVAVDAAVAGDVEQKNVLRLGFLGDGFEGGEDAGFGGLGFGEQGDVGVGVDGGGGLVNEAGEAGGVGHRVVQGQGGVGSRKMVDADGQNVEVAGGGGRGAVNVGAGDGERWGFGVDRGGGVVLADDDLVRARIERDF